MIKKIIRNVFSNWVGYAVNMIVAFFLSPFIVHSLGNTGYGIWVLAGSLTGYLGILDFGLRPAIVKYVAKYNELQDDQKINEVINSTIAVFGAVAVLVFVLSVILAFISGTIFNVPPEYHSKLKIIIILVGLNIAVSFPFGVFQAVLNALQRFDLLNTIQISVFLARSIFIVVFLKLGGGLITLSIITLLAGLTHFLLQARWCAKVFPLLRINKKYVGRKTLKMIAGFSLYTFIIGIAGRISFQTDSIVIGAFMSAGAITFYAIGGTLVEYLSTLISYISVTISPVASAFEARKDYEGLRKLLIVGTKYCVVAMIPIGITYLLLGEIFINLWMGPEYGKSSSIVLTILLWGSFGYISQFVAGSIYYGLGKVKLLAYAFLSSAIVNIVLSVILVKPYGIYGVALGTAIPQLIFGAIFHPLYICHLLRLNVLRYIFQSYFKPLLVSIPFIILAFGARSYFTFHSLFEFAFIIVAITAVHFAFCLFFALETNHKKTILQKGNVFLRRLTGNK